MSMIAAILFTFFVTNNAVKSKKNYRRMDEYSLSTIFGTTTESKDWCVKTFKAAKGLLPGHSWGDLDMESKLKWKDLKCEYSAGDELMEIQLGNISSVTHALKRADEFKYTRFINTQTYNNVSLIYFGAQTDVIMYEFRYPWEKYICPGSIAIDIGTQVGDTTLPMAVASRGGVVLGFEMTAHSYFAVEWVVRLNPLLNIIPYNFGVIGRGSAHYAGKFRMVPIFPWLHKKLVSIGGQDMFQKVSFVKVDIDGTDFEIVLSFKELANKYKPLFLIEWFQNFRDEGCSGKSKSIWDAAASMEYSIWDWKMEVQFSSCEAALEYLSSDKVVWKSKSKSSRVCGNYREESDLCDLLIVPPGFTDQKSRDKFCQTPMTSSMTAALIDVLM